MALLTSIVRKEALLPVHTAAFAATQLLPIIFAGVHGHVAATPGNPVPLDLCKEVLVSTNVTPTDAVQACLQYAAAEPIFPTPHVSIRILLFVACKHRLVCLCLIDDVLLPGGQLSVARAAWAQRAALGGSSHVSSFQR